MRNNAKVNKIKKQKTGFRKRAGFFTILALLLAFPMQASAEGRLQDTGDKLVIVIDPGHGGENQGTIENGYEEKGMTIVTAQAMYEELSLYDDVEVHMTRTDDRDLSLEERAEFAKSVDADFLFSIHYNASESHELFGAEVWVSVHAPFNDYGYQFGNGLLKDLREKGLFIRGVKSRRKSDDDNYYGIIRFCEKVDVPAVIIEHCHVDEERDEEFCDTTEELQEFGRLDATAVAKYFGLKSSVLGVDYSGYEPAPAHPDVTAPLTEKDETPPEICQIDFLETDYDTGQLSLSVTAADYETPLLYYSYSLDGGKTYTRREIWPNGDALTGSYSDTFTLNLQIPSGTTPTVILRAYNMYDLYTESNPYISAVEYSYGEEAVEAVGPVQTPEEEIGGVSGNGREDTDESADDSDEAPKEISFLTFLKICLVIVAAFFFVLLLSQVIDRARRKKHRRQRRNVDGDKRNQQR